MLFIVHCEVLLKAFVEKVIIFCTKSIYNHVRDESNRHGWFSLYWKFKESITCWYVPFFYKLVCSLCLKKYFGSSTIWNTRLLGHICRSLTKTRKISMDFYWIILVCELVKLLVKILHASSVSTTTKTSLAFMVIVVGHQPRPITLAGIWPNYSLYWTWKISC